MLKTAARKMAPAIMPTPNSMAAKGPPVAPESVREGPGPDDESTGEAAERGDDGLAAEDGDSEQESRPGGPPRPAPFLAEPREEDGEEREREGGRERREEDGQRLEYAGEEEGRPPDGRRGGGKAPEAERREEEDDGQADVDEDEGRRGDDGEERREGPEDRPVRVGGQGATVRGPLVPGRELPRPHEPGEDLAQRQEEAAGVPEGDPDADGRPNLIEYAVGSDPNAGPNPPYLELAYETNAFFLSFRKGPGGSDMRYTVEGSPSLAPASWSPSQVTILETNAASFRALYNGPPASGFLRVKFALAP